MKRKFQKILYKNTPDKIYLKIINTKPHLLPIGMMLHTNIGIDNCIPQEK